MKQGKIPMSIETQTGTTVRAWGRNAEARLRAQLQRDQFMKTVMQKTTVPETRKPKPLRPRERKSDRPVHKNIRFKVQYHTVLLGQKVLTSIVPADAANYRQAFVLDQEEHAKLLEQVGQ
jgi:hypothetical protein